MFAKAWIITGTYFARPRCLSKTYHHYGSMLYDFRISVENAYMEEKEDTAAAMGEIAVNAG